MLYRDLGRTGYRVSQLGFGAMRLPMVGEGEEARVDRALAIPMFHRAFEAGVNYVDSAVGYGNRDSQRAVGDAVKSWGREKIVVSTKNPYYGEEEKDWWQNLEDSLYNLGRVYGLWDVARKRYARAVARGRSANLCEECGKCEEKCPQKLPIREQLKEAHTALAE